MQKLWLKLINKGFITLKSEKKLPEYKFFPDIRPPRTK